MSASLLLVLILVLPPAWCRLLVLVAVLFSLAPAGLELMVEGPLRPMRAPFPMAIPWSRRLAGKTPGAGASSPLCLAFLRLAVAVRLAPAGLELVVGGSCEAHVSTARCQSSSQHGVYWCWGDFGWLLGFWG